MSGRWEGLLMALGTFPPRWQVKGLIEAGLFKYIRVISGASGGSILAAFLAMKTEKELLQEVLVPSFTSDFKVRLGPPQHGSLQLPVGP
jgi:predicted acylesterase/phospholipase RssA